MSRVLIPVTSAHHYEQAQCAYFDSSRCQSCDLLAIKSGARLSHKLSYLMQQLASHEVRPGVIEPIVLGQHPWGSRRKIKMAVTGNLDRPILGLVRRDLTSEDLSECPLMPPTFQGLFESLRGLVTEYEISPYNIGERRGELKHIILLSNADTSQVILRFILRSAGLVPRIRKLVGLLQDSFPWIRVVTCNIQPKHAAILEGADEIFLTQERQIRECFGDIPLYLSPQSFMQVTPEIAHKLYTRAQEFAQLHAPKMVLDLFCGVGGFALHTAKSASSLIGVEVSPSAIASAMRSAGEMGLKNTLFISADVDEFLRSYSGSHPDLIIVNPPRRGLSKEAVAHIVSLAPQRILYSSCSPESFARDAQLLSGYTLERITPFDMFPMTMHCEVLGEFCLS